MVTFHISPCMMSGNAKIIVIDYSRLVLYLRVSVFFILCFPEREKMWSCGLYIILKLATNL